MKEANPESLLLYKELLLEIAGVIERMGDLKAYILIQKCCYDRRSTDLANKLGIRWFSVDNQKWSALHRIRDHLYSIGIFDKKKRNISEKSRARLRYEMNRAEFFEPR